MNYFSKSILSSLAFIVSVFVAGWFGDGKDQWFSFPGVLCAVLFSVGFLLLATLNLIWHYNPEMAPAKPKWDTEEAARTGRRTLALLILAALATSPMYGQSGIVSSGCVNSPENPTLLLAALGGGMMILLGRKRWRR